MYGRWFNLAIVFLWITTMSWLVKEKVLPPLLTGPPPDQQSLIEAAESDQEVAWLIRWNQCPIGWAKSKTDRNDDGTVRMTTDVHFDHLPLSGMVPKWLAALPAWTGLKQPLKKTDPNSPFGFPVDSSLETDANSELLISPEGKLQQINSSITLVSLGQTIDLIGKVDGNEVELDVLAEGFTYNTKLHLDPKVLMGNALTPQTHLPNLHTGQTWMVGVLNPFSYPIGSVEVIFAKVIGREPYQHEGQTIAAWIIEYHEQPNVEYAGKQGSRCRLWVHPDGMVLRQELRLFKATLIFERTPIDKITELSKVDCALWQDDK